PEKATLRQNHIASICKHAPDSDGILRTVEQDDHLSIHLRYDIIECSYNNVVDLRIPETRMVFCLKCIELMATLQPLRSNHKFNWLDGLAILLDPHFGGNFVTTCISKQAAVEGAEAIIFPSARNDFVAAYTNNEVEYFCGWNLVDISNYSASATEFSPL